MGIDGRAPTTRSNSREDGFTLMGITQPSHQLLDALRTATLDTAYVSLGGRRTASVHEFYRYPARFSPGFAAAAIEAFTVPGDTVIDPFGGGGTTAIEAQRHGRHCVTADINSLATFLTTAKTSLYSDSSLAEVDAFAETVPSLRLKAIDQNDADWRAAGYWRNIESPETWRVRNFLANALRASADICSNDSEMLTRCALLRTGQWALDMRESIPTVGEFREQLCQDLLSMAEVARLHRIHVLETWGQPMRPSVVESGLPESASDPAFREVGPPALVLTSPPYPGVYVNYHRWKVRGRRESPAPYWLANRLDGHGLSHYTMSARNSIDLYFDKLDAAMNALATLVSPDTWLVQVVGFSDVHSHLSRYLNVMESAGFIEARFGELAVDAPDGRLWRRVPSRRWWVSAKDMEGVARNTSREVVLIHKLR